MKGMTMSMILTEARVVELISKAISGLTAVQSPAHQVATANVEEIHKDPCYLALIEAKKDIVAQLANPKYMMVRGSRNRGQLINQTKEALVTINNEINEMFQGSYVRRI